MRDSSSLQGYTHMCVITCSVETATAIPSESFYASFFSMYMPQNVQNPRGGALGLSLFPMLVGEHPLASSSAPKTSTTVSGAGLQRCISCCSSFLPLSSLFAIAVFAVSEFFDLWVVDCKEHMLEEDDELANDVRSYYEWWLYIVGNLDVGIVGNLVICLICLLTLLNLLAEGVNLRPNSGFDRTFRITARELQGEFRGELRGELWGELAGDVEHFDHRDVPMSAKAAAEDALVASLKERDAKKAEAAIAEAKAAGGHESSRPPPPPPPPPRDASSEVLLAVASSEAPPPAANSLVDPAIMDLRFKVRETEEVRKRRWREQWCGRPRRMLLLSRPRLTRSRRLAARPRRWG